MSMPILDLVERMRAHGVTAEQLAALFTETMSAGWAILPPVEAKAYRDAQAAALRSVGIPVADPDAEALARARALLIDTRRHREEWGGHGNHTTWVLLSDLSNAVAVPPEPEGPTCLIERSGAGSLNDAIKAWRTATGVSLGEANWCVQNPPCAVPEDVAAQLCDSGLFMRLD